mgnify:FL=1
MILWIDDDHSSLAYLELSMEESGIRTCLVRNVDDLQDTLLRNPGVVWDLILLDVMMPTGNFLDFFRAEAGYASGIELARIFRTDEDFRSLKDVPIVFLTVNTSKEVTDYAIRNGIDVWRKDTLSTKEILSKINGKLLRVKE